MQPNRSKPAPAGLAVKLLLMRPKGNTEMNICHAATIAAYPIKEEMGGGFRGAYKAIGQERIASDRFDTLEQAKFWAQKMAGELHAGARLAAYRRKGEYKANVWVPA